MLSSANVPVHGHAERISDMNTPQRAANAVHDRAALDGGEHDSGSHWRFVGRKRGERSLRTLRRFARRSETEAARGYEDRSGPAVQTRRLRQRLGHAGARVWLYRPDARSRYDSSQRAPLQKLCAAAMSDDEDGELAAMRRAARNAALPGAAGDRLEELRRRAAASRGGSDAYFDDGDDRRAVGPPAGSDAAHSGRGSAYARPGDDDDDDDDDDEPVRTIHRPRSVLAALAACSLAACSACKANPKLCEMLFRPACRRRRPSLWN